MSALAPVEIGSCAMRRFRPRRPLGQRDGARMPRRRRQGNFGVTERPLESPEESRLNFPQPVRVRRLPPPRRLLSTGRRLS